MVRLPRRVLYPFIAALSVCGSASSEEPRAETLRAWENYLGLTEDRIKRELESEDGFLVMDFWSSSDASRAREAILSGDVFVLKMETRNVEGKQVNVPEGMIHHWYGSVFVPQADLEDVLKWEQDYSQHSAYFQEVEESRLLSREENVFTVFLRLRRKKVITVHYNTEHLVVYSSHGPTKASSKSEATHIAELESPGTAQEREKPAGRDQGFLWRLSSYWRFKQERDGVIVECESVSLSQGIPTGTAFMFRSFVESVPKESLKNALLPIRRELGKP